MVGLVKNGAGVVKAILYVEASIIVCPCLSHLLSDSHSLTDVTTGAEKMVLFLMGVKETI